MDISVSNRNSTNNNQQHQRHQVDEDIYAVPIPFEARNAQNKLKSFVSKSEVALAATPHKYQRKPPERRASDVGSMFYQSILQRQGSDAVGERMAHTDYADPRQILYGLHGNSQTSLQRDSFFSLTSSSDSMYANSFEQQQHKNLSFDYENNVEACLEREFRDSAIYSDDNEKRFDTITKKPSKSWVLQQIENFSK